MVERNKRHRFLFAYSIIGSGLLVNTVTAGLIMIIRPFTTNRRPFIKDVLFYMSAVIWSAAILIRRSINLSDSIGMSVHLFVCEFYYFSRAIFYSAFATQENRL